ncbi:MAG: argininosuccinate lyase [Bacteroidia bacterium]|nr:argininosuccinate lyase [Bacteroidia bacterium]
MKLWQKNQEGTSSETARIIEQFTVGRDREFDILLAKHDVIGSVAHAQMLHHIGLLSADEWQQIDRELKQIEQEIANGKFSIEPGVEDVHSQIELMLTRRIGEAGKKIHSGRSRNDQVLLDIKLFLRSEMLVIAKQVNELFNLLLKLADEHKQKLLPGYTHFQLAMPSSFGLWFSAYAESLSDDLEWLLAAYRICNKNPLGSGAGYGSSFPLDRELTTRLLGFEALNYNVVYAQMTRGKTEKSLAQALAAIAASLAKLAADVCLYMNQQFGFISFPDELTTGSSIMPHKKNPDVFELIRAKCNRIQALPNEFTILLANLPSGYHRDLQLTKEMLFPALGDMQACIQMTGFMLEHIQVEANILDDERYVQLFSVERVNELVLNGVPFRDAYKIVAEEVQSRKLQKPPVLHHTHAGSIGNLCLENIQERMTLLFSQFPVDQP